MKLKQRESYDYEIISFMERTGQIDADEARFMRSYIRGVAQ